MNSLDRINVNELNNQELKTINGGLGVLAGIGLAILAAAAYEHGKHFVVGALNPYSSNE